ncbi:hypothetical protein L202_08467 [Cryptococcus amylolentus CBS 6039]|uniref:Uncharacterized protein n=2 Tax=Cryptococcus amylolentus TaxID=104669 RepID=A0A1E3H9P0_9TREE|nr:hypothetical protein L202_08467 [Cryptococcus amylolentus CBS 6039]ODN73072.1 hypothetical protein L202_08467 [Cryptococcus amylolentus CBS 6039]
MFPECDAKGLQPWSNLVSLGGAHGLGLNISCEECDTLYTLMDKYGCDESLYECLRSQITFMAREKEWEMFIMASHGNDRILGKRALDKMDDKTFLEEGFSKRIRRLSDTWALAVYQALYTKDPNLSPETICPGSNEWTSGKWRTELSRAVDVAASDFINLYHWRKDLLATLFAKD